MKLDPQRAALPVAGAAAAVAAITLAALAWSSPSPLLLVPMMGLEPCLTPSAENTVDPAMMQALAPACGGPEGSAAALVESTVAGLQTPGTTRQPFELGYTLNVPLLKLFKAQGADWAIDQDQVDRLARTLRDNPRPAILYLFSTHFSQGAPIEKALAADPANLSWTQAGPLQDSTYYGAPIYNWSFASTDNAITRRRIQAGQAMLDAVCRLGPQHAAKLRGVTLLGELHHLFPDFEAGMGFQRPYLITDYSEQSKAGFRAFLRQRFGTIERLNAALGSQWASFDALDPPGKNIRSETLRDYTEHIDAFAHGSLPIAGWTHVPDAGTRGPARIRVYLNGRAIGSTAVDKHRQDVLQALPELGTANVGWRYDLNYARLPAGLHRLDLFVDRGQGGLEHLTTRRIAVMDRTHATPKPQPEVALPKSRPLDAGTRASVDFPADLSSYFYNPMVPLWHEFRRGQVVHYLQALNRAWQPPCLAHTPRYVHQIVPFTNPSWDETRFAIESSLQPLPGIGLGVSLYGEPTYGTSFSNWLGSTRHRAYGVTEFHPLKAMGANEMRQVLNRHEQQGARFLSFFMEPRWQGRKASRHTNLFSFDPQNREYGSDRLYESVRGVLAQGGQPLRAPAAAPAVPAAARSTP